MLPNLTYTEKLKRRGEREGETWGGGGGGDVIILYALTHTP